MPQFRALRPTDAEAFVKYLEALDYQHAPQWSGCFCRFYHTNCSMDAWIARDRNDNRQETLQAIREGLMHGYLAFENDQLIGWLNANAVSAYPRLAKFVEPYVQTQHPAAMVCFVIHPEYRGQGVASGLLRFAINDLMNQGMTEILGFPFEDPEHPQRAYHGSFSMYLKAGFTLVESRKNQHIVRYLSSLPQ